MISEELKAQIEKWIDDLKYQSEGFVEYLKNFPPDNSSYWCTLTKACVKVPVEKLRQKKGILYVGDAGCGKHSAAYTGVLQLVNQDFSAVFISGDNFNFLTGEQYGIYEGLNTLLDSYEQKNLCLVLETPECCIDSSELLRRLGQFACMYAVHDELPLLFLMVITEKESCIPNLLRERLSTVRCTLPSAEQRNAFIQSYYENISLFTSAEELEEVTECLNFSQLQDLLDYTKNYFEDERADDKLLLEQLYTQLPPKSTEMYKQLFLQKAIDFIDALPQLLERIPTANNVQYDRKENLSTEDSTNLQDKNLNIASFDNMTTREIAVDLFGEEGVAEIEMAFAK